MGVGLALPAAGAVFGTALVVESLLANNDDLGNGELTIEDGENRVRLTGNDTRSDLTVTKSIIRGECSSQ
jgi:hypothetical protein